MKSNLFLAILLIGVVFLFSQCSETELDFSPKKENMENISETSKQLGLAVAKELNATIRNLHKQGLDYSNANGSLEFRDAFYNDFIKASPNAIKSRCSTSNFYISPEEFVRRVDNLTKIQVSFLNRIIDECGASTTEDEFYAVLIAINNDIYETVPEIQQERLFNVTSVLYYGMREIQTLENLGLMVPTPRSRMKHLLMKTRSESGDSSFSEVCHKVLATSMAVAIATPIPGDELIVGGVLTAAYTGYAVYSAGVWLYEYIVCKRAEVNCIDKFKECVQSGLASWKCTDCLRYCEGQGVWDCPRPY